MVRCKRFFFIFRIKENSGNIYSRVLDLAESATRLNPDGNYQHGIHIEGKEFFSRRLWRLPGLRYSLYDNAKEAFLIEKTNVISLETSQQYFISNRPAGQWSGEDIINRVLLHWDTETGVFGVKDNTFHEDKVRYKTVQGAMGHVTLLNAACNSLSAPIFENWWNGEPMSCRIQFLKDNPEYNPLS